MLHSTTFYWFYRGLLSASVVTTCSRFWLIDYGTTAQNGSADDQVISLASKVYNEAVAVPVVARFVVFTRSHHETEAQLRVLCITEDFDASTTLECQEQFHEIARSDPVEVYAGLCKLVFSVAICS